MPSLITPMRGFQPLRMFGAGFDHHGSAALSEDWLARPDKILAFYGGLRDRFEPGKPLWLTETAQTACGGDRWASTFLDSFRYLNQLGTLARRGVQVHMHNTLASSDYGLLDETTYAPRPNYWAALLWRRFMGTTVLNPGTSPAPSLHLYAHCLRSHPGGVALLAINASTTKPETLDVPIASGRYTLTAQDPMGGDVELNDRVLKLGPGELYPRKRSRSRARAHVVTPKPDARTRRRPPGDEAHDHSPWKSHLCAREHHVSCHPAGA